MSFGFDLHRYASVMHAVKASGASAPPPAGPSTTSVNPLVSQEPPLRGRTIFPGDLDTMPFYDQGKSNGCGTTCLAMIMTYLGKPTDRAAIDGDMRRMNIFSSPHHLVDHARENGLEAEMYNRGTWDELKSYVDRGVPTQAIISADGSGDLATLHYVAVVGYGTDASGTEFVLLHEPNDGDDPTTPSVEGQVRRVSKDIFLELWSKPPAGFDNFFLAFGAPGTALPWSRTDGVQGSAATAGGVADLVNGLDRVIRPESPGGFVRGVLDIQAGLVGTVGGAVAGAFELSGDWMHDKVDGVPVVSNVLHPVIDVWTGIGEIGSNVVHTTSETVEDLGEMVEKLGRGDFAGAADEVGEVVVNVGRGVVDTVADAGEAVGRAVRSFFRW